MLSRQINFYLLPTEQEWFDGILRKAGKVCVVSQMHSKFRPQFLDTTIVREFGQEDLKVHLILEADLERIRAIELPSQDKWVVDSLRSPVIEYWRCFAGGNLLRRGRLYFTEQFFDESDRLTKKNSHFVEWARAVLTNARHEMTRRADGDYIASGAEEAERNGSFRLVST